MQDHKFASRSLAKFPGFAAVVLLPAVGAIGGIIHATRINLPAIRPAD